ncbi:MAG: GspH/FimT family pseudopilin [Chromatiaceae bacterium]|nr:GspH/FimT family pseudopilin [Chromatiaceae bacterium]
MTGKARGLTLPELVVTLAVAGTLLALAIPSFSRMVERKNLQAATETLVSDLRLARSESAKRNQDVRVSFKAGENWCYGLRDTSADCDCAAADCTMDGVLTVQSGVEFNDVKLDSTSFSGNKTTWDHLRSTADNGTAVLKTGKTGYETRIMVSSIMGRIRTCSPTSHKVAQYPDC